MSRDAYRLLYRTPVAEWTEEALGLLTAEELGAICQLLGVAHSGTKAGRRARIWRVRHLRLVLAGYATDGVAALAANYTTAELLALCRAADVYAGSTKYARAAALLQWRNGCRLRGQEALDEAQAAAQTRPRQSRLL
jgi:hypothetical protein